MSLKLSDFDYQLPEELIARYPASRRSDSRLLCLDRRSGDLQHRVFRQLPELLDANDLLVFNNTRVIPARLFARKESGGKVEVMIERIQQDNRLLAQLKCSRSPGPGSRLIFATEASSDGAGTADGGTGISAEVLARQDNFFQLQFDEELDLMAFLKTAGHMPLPPYIKRDDEQLDSERYQTVYASNEGAVAAPTAGLHFDETLFAALDDLGVSQAYLTLHVGAGTFQPVRVENIEQHRMHREWIEVDESVCEAVRQCRARGGRVIAVGTTSVRSLETAASSGEIQPFTGETDIFIYPGYEFKAVDAIVTNFHLPESTLLMLVSAFSSKKMLLDAYHEAIREKYRFFSYGDAMFLY
jgi:S-adenosylmethionine:tRNA ribosyltransferase-isomerase